MDHVEQASSPDPASTSLTIARSPARSTSSEGPRSAFDQSRTAFEKKEWEFPSQAYPSYTLNPSDTSTTDRVDFQSFRPRPTDHAATTERWGDAWYLSTMNDFRTSQWDLPSMSDGALDPTSEAYFFDGDFTRQVMDDLLSTRDIAT